MNVWAEVGGLFGFLWAVIRGGRHCFHCGRFTRRPFHAERQAFCNAVCFRQRKNLLATRDSLEAKAREAGVGA